MTENKRFEMVDDKLICFDGDYFDLNKQSDRRSFVKVANYVVKENEQLKKENVLDDEIIIALTDKLEEQGINYAFKLSDGTCFKVGK